MAAPIRSESGRLLRFAFVGGAGFLVDAGVLAALHHGAGLDPFVARLVSVSLAVLTTWRLNRALTFGASSGSQMREGVRYGSVAALSAAMNYIVYALILMARPAFPPVAALAGGTLAAMALSYAGYSRFAFKGGAAARTGAWPRSHTR